MHLNVARNGLPVSVRLVRVLVRWRNDCEAHACETGEMASATSYVWPSVVIYRGATLVKTRTIVKCDWSDNFGALLEMLGDKFTNETAVKIVISSNEKLIDPTHVVPLDALERLLETYGCHYVG